MAGLVDPLTLTQFAAAASAGQLTPQLGGGGASGGGGGPVVGAPTPGPGGSGPSLPPMLAKLIQQILLSDVKSRFSTGTSPDGVKWLPLKHARPNGGDSPLRDTGILMASFTAGNDGRSVWVGTTHPGAALQNFGGTVRGKGKMLAIPLTKEAKRSGGPQRWKGGKLQFRPTKKPRVFLLLGSQAAAKPKKPRAKRRGKKGMKGRVGAAINILKKRIAKVRKTIGKAAKKAAKGVKGRVKRARRRGKKRGAEGLLRKLLGLLKGAEKKQATKTGQTTAPTGPPLVAQFLLVDQVTIPARPFMGVSDKAWGQITDAVTESVVRGWMSGPIGFGASIG